MTRPLRREDGRLDPTQSAALLDRQVRAYQPWPGSFIDTVVGRLIVHRAHAVPAAAATEPGVVGPGPDLRLATSDGWLVVDGVQPAGGRLMPGPDLLRGRPLLAASRVV
jgi:methionyl-tRNA formyltransferase